jgi:hypothetical protein
VIPDLFGDPLNITNISIPDDVPVVIHLHGGVVRSTSDGYPGAFTTKSGIQGP